MGLTFSEAHEAIYKAVMKPGLLTLKDEVHGTFVDGDVGLNVIGGDKTVVYSPVFPTSIPPSLIHKIELNGDVLAEDSEIDGYVKTALIQSRLYSSNDACSVPFEYIFNTPIVKTKADSLKIELKKTDQGYHCLKELDVSSGSKLKTDLISFYGFVEKLTNTLELASSDSRTYRAR